MKKVKGFTLIELLVVISVIALLLSILMPSLGRIKQQARAVVCRSNLRQILLGLKLYSSDNDDKSLDSAGGGEFWFTQIATYMGDDYYKSDPESAIEGNMQIIMCPSTKEPINPDGGSPGSFEYQWRYHVMDFGAEGSYGINAWVGGWNLEAYESYLGSGYGDMESKSFRSGSFATSNVPAFADCVWVDTVPLDTDQATSLTNNEIEGYDFGLDRVCIDRHEMAVNVGFLDGSAKKVKLEDLWTLKWNRVWQSVWDIELPDDRN